MTDDKSATTSLKKTGGSKVKTATQHSPSETIPTGSRDQKTAESDEF